MNHKFTKPLLLGLLGLFSFMFFLWLFTDSPAGMVSQKQEFGAEKNNKAETSPGESISTKESLSIKQTRPDTSDTLERESRYPIAASGDLNVVFDQYYDLARQGDDGSVNRISEVIGNCTAVYKNGHEIYSIEELDVLVLQHRILPYAKDQVSQLISDCAYIGSFKPAGVNFFEWVRDFNKQSSEAGYGLAQLSLASDQPVSHHNYARSVELLEQNISPGNHRVFYQAYHFYKKYHNARWDGRDWDVHARKWMYLGCEYDEKCDPEIMRRNWSSELEPNQISTIVQESESLDAKIRRGELPGFSDYRTQDEITEIQYSDGGYDI